MDAAYIQDRVRIASDTLGVKLRAAKAVAILAADLTASDGSKDIAIWMLTGIPDSEDSKPWVRMLQQGTDGLVVIKRLALMGTTTFSIAM